MKLYSYFRSSCSYRVRIALNLKKLPYEVIPVHLLNDGGEQRKDTYRKLNPIGQVPSLVLKDGTVLAQSMAILEYLEEAYPENPLLPRDVIVRSKVRQACEIINSSIQPLQNLSVMQKIGKNFGASEEQVKSWCRHWIQNGLSAYEKLISKTVGTYSFGSQVTLADCFLIPQIYNAKRFGLSLNEFPMLTKADQNCRKLEAFIQADPDHQVDTPKN